MKEYFMKCRFKKTIAVGDIQLTIMTSARSIVEYYLELTKETNITIYNDKEQLTFTKEQFIKYISKFGVWSFAEKNSKRIFLWYVPSKTPDVFLMSVLGHELGHLKSPHHTKIMSEELKAIKYADVSMDAYIFLQSLLGN